LEATRRAGFALRVTLDPAFCCLGDADVVLRRLAVVFVLLLAFVADVRFRDFARTERPLLARRVFTPPP
jgi:hypothetical protein